MIENGVLAHALEAQGRRPSMEDAHVLEVSHDPYEVVGAIFDGHLGASVAKRAAGSFLDVFKEQRPNEGVSIGAAMIATFGILQEEAVRISSLVGGGACACAFYASKDKIVTANLGDAEIVYLPDTGKVEVLTTAHRLDNPDEILRVYHTGAFIKQPYYFEAVRTQFGQESIGNGLMPTRALGDTHMDKWGMSHEPTISLLAGYTLPHISLPGTLIAACDGFWDVIKAEELADLTRTLDRDAQRIAQRLFDEAMTGRATTDNLTVIAVRIE